MPTRTCPSCGAQDYGTPFCISCQQPFPRQQSAATSGETGSASPSQAMRAAGFLRRFGALFVDWIICSVVGDLVLLSYQLGLGKEKGIINMDGVMVVMTVISLAYFTILIGDGGQTLGKKLFGVRVVRTDGSNVTYSKAFVRSLGYLLSTFFGTFLGFLWALWDRRNQTWHDKIAGTVVVRI